jgi:hypothetical protein
MAVKRKPLEHGRIGLRPWSDMVASVAVWVGPLVSLAAYALAALAVYTLVGHALTWGTRTLDDLRYGTPRHTLVSGVVGHSDSADSPTHLMALNLEGQVVVLEVPGGDAEQVRVLAGPYLFGEDGAYEVPRLALHDMDGDGTDDLVVTVKGELVVYLNKEGTFRLPSNEERAVLEEVRDGRE